MSLRRRKWNSGKGVGFDLTQAMSSLAAFSSGRWFTNAPTGLCVCGFFLFVCFFLSFFLLFLFCFCLGGGVVLFCFVLFCFVLFCFVFTIR